MTAFQEARRIARICVGVVLCAGLDCTPASGAAQPDQAEPTATAVPIDAAPIIDGRLEEPFWRTIQPVTGFLQREPEEGRNPTERTEVRIAFDERFIYFGLIMFDSEPEKIRGSILQREGQTGQDDRVMIALDTYGDRRNGYIFESTSLGAQGDAIITDESPNWSWEGVFWSETRFTPQGWTLEVAIPFSTLRYPDTASPEMGLALYRSIRRKNEEVFWPLIGRDYRSGFSQVSRYGRLLGLRDLRRSRNVQVKPYGLLGRQTPGTGGARADTPRDVGLDVRYALTSNTTLDVTVNTDFAQVEADNAQINLTRFNLFFPEKREFFLEQNGLFSFGVPGTAATFFSRRMGLAQPILAGGRVSGKSGALTYGLLNLQTGDEGPLDGVNYGVARVRADLTPRRGIGAILTNVQGSGTFNRAAGADLAFRFFRSSALTAWVSNVWTEQRLASSAAGNANLLLRNDRFSVEADYLNIGRHFDPAVGFVRRVDMIRYEGEVGWYPRPATPGIRQLRFNASGSFTEGQDHERQSTNAYSRAAVVFDTQDEVAFELSRDTDRPHANFTIAGMPVLPGQYDDAFASVSAQTNGSRRFYGNVNAGTGSLYGADRWRVGGSGTVKVSPHLRIGTNVERNTFQFPVENGRVATTLVGINAFVAANRRLYSNWLVQYDSVSKDLQANVRVRLLYRPGSDFYFVFNTMRRFDDRFDPRPASFDRRAVVTKITYMLGL